MTPVWKMSSTITVDVCLLHFVLGSCSCLNVRIHSDHYLPNTKTFECEDTLKPLLAKHQDLWMWGYTQTTTCQTPRPLNVRIHSNHYLPNTKTYTVSQSVLRLYTYHILPADEMQTQHRVLQLFGGMDQLGFQRVEHPDLSRLRAQQHMFRGDLQHAQDATLTEHGPDALDAHRHTWLSQFGENEGSSMTEQRKRPWS